MLADQDHEEEREAGRVEGEQRRGVARPALRPCAARRDDDQTLRRFEEARLAGQHPRDVGAERDRERDED